MAEEGKAAKKETVIEQVAMKDGRTVGFAGTRKMVKDYIIDADAGSVEVVIDFRNGETVRQLFTQDIKLPDGTPLLLHAAGHGLVQKEGDEAASEKEVDDAYEAVRALNDRLANGEWNVQRESGGGFSGAGVVVRALMEATSQTQEKVRSFIESRLEAMKADAEKSGEKAPTRAALYQSFRKNTKVAEIIARMEKEKIDKQAPAVDVESELEALKAA